MASIYDKSSLVLIPSGTKTGKVYSQKPVSGDGDFTFTRSSAATRVNADGFIEKERSNQVLQSNQFDTTWVASNASVTGGQSGYDGSSDAWLLDKSGSSGRLDQTISFSGVQTMSVYAKAGTKNWLRVRCDVSNGLHANSFFDLSTGTMGSANFLIDRSITSVGGGWYKCTMSWNNPTTIFRIYVADSSNDSSGTSGNIYIQDAQLEQGLVARDYIETTTTAVEGGITDNVPRLDYTDSSCPALLLEPQRTNLVTQSEYFGDSYWTKSRASFVNGFTSPEGLSNSYKLVEDSSNGLHAIYQNANITIPVGTATLSVFVKENGRNFFQIRTGSAAGITNAPLYANFDLVNNLVTAQSAGANNAIIEQYANGWKRLSVSFTITSGTQAALVFQTITSGTSVIGEGYTGDGTSGVFIYGAQLEAGSYPTSYIPTYGSSVTRVAESVIKTNVSSILNDNAGTLFLEIQGEVDSLSRALTLSNSTSAERVQIFYQGSTKITTNIIRANVSQVDLNVFTKVVDQNATLKVIIRYEPNNAKMFVNGEQIAVDTSVNIPLGLNKISFDNGIGNSKFTGKVKNLIYIPTAITDQEAIDLTTI